MSFSHFFIDRPIFATVVSIVIVIIGGMAYFQLPVSQYPDIALPTIVVSASYPGATPETIAETVATPLEQEINGVEGMIYMSSQSTTDGNMQLTITFEMGTDIDQAQVLVQNKVSTTIPRLPAEVQQIGVTTEKTSPEMVMVVHLISPDASLDQLYISNYAYLQINDTLSRLKGIGDLQIFGSSEYSMRIWLDVEKLATLELTAGDVLNALREQNVQVAAGTIGQQPIETDNAFQLMVASQGRLKTSDEFAEVVIKAGDDGRLVRLNDVARIELGAVDYSVRSYLDRDNAIAMIVYQRPGTNGVETMHEVIATMEELKKDFPPGLDYTIAYNPTQFVEESISEVFITLFQAGALVILTVFIFLQTWQATIIPVAAIPVSLIGTFGAMLVLGFSLNSLSLFGLVLAIGVVVDDAIVVVENVERLIAKGLSPKNAAKQAMDEVGSALIATTLVLIAVFVPTAFIPGISGQFYQQFSLTISVATAISTIVSLTMSPAYCALFLKPADAPKGLLTRGMEFVFGWFFGWFNRIFDWASHAYSSTVRRFIRISFVALVLYVGMLGMTGWGFTKVPTGFIPPQDQGYLIISIQLPPGASLERTNEVVKEVGEIALNTPGVANAVSFAGFSGATRAVSPSAAAVFTALTDAKERAREGLSSNVILRQLAMEYSKIEEAQVFVIPPPPVSGIGSAGGFKLMVQDKTGGSFEDLERFTWDMIAQAQQNPGMTQMFTSFSSGTPQLYADIDRTKVRMLDVPVSNVFETLQVFLGSAYVNDFNFLGRTYRVTAQAEDQFRDEASDIQYLRTRSSTGAIVPLGSVVDVSRRTGPDRVVRYNLFPASDINGSTVPGYSTGQAIGAIEQIAAQKLPPGYGFEWTDLAFQEKQAGNTALFIFPLCVLFVFLALSAQYESWILPLAVILIVPLCLLFGLAGVWLRGMDNNILVQIGFVVLVGLACKNAILIVEFAKQLEDEGKSRIDAAVEACHLRLRAILMTAFSFVLGVIPLLIATGAGAEMRRALGTAVFSGMLGVTVIGLFLTPVFYVVLRRLSASKTAPTPAIEGAAVTPAVDKPEEQG